MLVSDIYSLNMEKRHRRIGHVQKMVAGFEFFNFCLLSFINQVNLFSLTANFQRTSSVVTGAYLN